MLLVLTYAGCFSFAPFDVRRQYGSVTLRKFFNHQMLSPLELVRETLATSGAWAMPSGAMLVAMANADIGVILGGLALAIAGSIPGTR
jgi:hypothetical protein